MRIQYGRRLLNPGAVFVVAGFGAAALALPRASPPGHPVAIAAGRPVGVFVPPAVVAAALPVGVYRNPCCADWNFDGEVNTNDYFEYKACFFGQCPANRNADLNGDCVVNSNDCFAFIQCYFNHPCQ